MDNLSKTMIEIESSNIIANLRFQFIPIMSNFLKSYRYTIKTRIITRDGMTLLIPSLGKILILKSNTTKGPI